MQTRTRHSPGLSGLNCSQPDADHPARWVRFIAPPVPGPLDAREVEDLRVPLGLKGWALGRLRLKRLQTCHGRLMAGFKSCWAADSLNGLKRLNAAGELPRSMVREAPQ